MKLCRRARDLLLPPILAAPLFRRVVFLPADLRPRLTASAFRAACRLFRACFALCVTRAMRLSLSMRGIKNRAFVNPPPIIADGRIAGSGALAVKSDYRRLARRRGAFPPAGNEPPARSSL